MQGWEAVEVGSRRTQKQHAQVLTMDVSGRGMPRMVLNGAGASSGEGIVGASHGLGYLV